MIRRIVYLCAVYNTVPPVNGAQRANNAESIHMAIIVTS